MLTVLMECRNAEPLLAQTLSGLVAGAVEGLISDVILIDHGSVDGTLRVADAAGCRVYSDWNLADVLATARGSWILAIEAGARPQAGWVEEVSEYLAFGAEPARFSPSRTFRRKAPERWLTRASPLENGCLMPKARATALCRPGIGLSELAKSARLKTLRSEIIPARVLAAQKPG